MNKQRKQGAIAHTDAPVGSAVVAALGAECLEFAQEDH
jgi:hypothetical protein